MTGRHRAGGGAHARAARAVETSEYVAFIGRLFYSLADRIAADPAALVHARELQSQLAEQINRGIWAANRGQSHYSQNDMAKILGLTRQAIAHRIQLGEQAEAARMQRLGGGALVRLGDIRRRRAELLESAGLPDITGSDRERRAAGQ